MLEQIDFEWAVKLNRYSLEFVGLWPRSEQTTWKKCMCNLRALIVFLISIFVIIIPAIHSLIRIHSDIKLVIDNLQFTLPVITSVLRLIIFWWKKEAVTLLIDMIADDWAKTKAPQDKIAMIVRAKTARIIITCAYGLMGSALALAIILPIFGHSMRYLTNFTDPGRPLPLQAYYIYDITESPQYEITFISQAISICLCVMLYTGIDNFLSLLIFHVSGQLDILRNRIAHLDKLANFPDALKNCIMDHARLLRAIKIIQDIFNIMLLILFLYFVILFAFYGFLITNLFQDGNYFSFSGLPYLVTIVTNTLGHMCVYCAVGEILSGQCDRIHYAAYYNKWYTLSPRNVRNLIVLMIRTNKPLYLSAGKVFPLTMATFCNLIKTSAGYISVLLTTRI